MQSDTIARNCLAEYVIQWVIQGTKHAIECYNMQSQKNCPIKYAIQRVIQGTTRYTCNRMLYNLTQLQGSMQYGWVMQGYVGLENLGTIHIALTIADMLHDGLGADLAWYVFNIGS